MKKILVASLMGFILSAGVAFAQCCPGDAVKAEAKAAKVEAKATQVEAKAMAKTDGCCPVMAKSAKAEKASAADCGTACGDKVKQASAECPKATGDLAADAPCPEDCGTDCKAKA